MRVSAVLPGVLAAVLLVAPAQSAQLLTDGSGYAGPVIDIGFVPSPGYYFSDQPQTFGNATVTGTWVATVFGQPYYGFGSNGVSSNSLIIATGYSQASVTIDFATPLAAFGGNFNYAPDPGLGFPFVYDAPTLAAYDSVGDLIASYDLAALAPIDAAGQNDHFAFRGIDGEGRAISRFVFSGSYIAMQVQGTADLTPPPPGPVPEPASWALLILGFGLTGAVLRQRRTRTA
ncbi:MAG: hypothetical protein CFE37_03825 [Alphaproteobacteria bacterium PA4]|nr:MAG: hypothetical protein CFE37_03825 [Alphaproteobacteria bacterium PA4]